jgi:hypothetical protein
VRDNASLTRPAWIEADLGSGSSPRSATPTSPRSGCSLHETRFGRAEQPAHRLRAGDLAQRRSRGGHQGARAPARWRRRRPLALGQGFLAHPDNQALRAALQSGTLPTRDYFNQLLRLVYRLIFLLTVEERGLLHPDGTAAAKALYAEGYSLKRLRERS